LIEGQPLRALVQGGYRDWLLLWTPGGWERVLWGAGRGGPRAVRRGARRRGL